jgi:hypothetical protein
VAGSGCTSSPNARPTASTALQPAPTATTPAEASTPTTAAFPPCRGEDINIAFGQAGAGLGHFDLSFIFTNTGNTCTVTGYPQVLGHRDTGWETMPVTRATASSYVPVPDPIGAIEHLKTAIVLLQGTNSGNYPQGECPTEPKAPPSYDQIAFIMPGDSNRLEVATPIGMSCGLEVSWFGRPH